MRLLIIAALLLSLPASAEVTFDWMRVGDPINACDTQPQGCFGWVIPRYQISKLEVTNTQYTEFLNAVAATDTNDLYNPNMGSGLGGITRSGSAGSYTYSEIVGREDMPVNFVTFYDALRFANWLHNEQPMGAQGNATTEDGAYTITPAGISANSITRNFEADIFIPSENEWYKAAYYDVGSASYFDYPAGSDTPTVCAVPGATANTANCGVIEADLTDVGSYTASASPNATFDQGGNVWEWNDTIIDVTDRGQRGGGFVQIADVLAASHRGVGDPGQGDFFVGFRVASYIRSVPSLSPLALALLGSLLALVSWRSLRTA